MRDVFFSRKFLVFAISNTAASHLLILDRLKSDEYGELIIWLFGLYFVFNGMQPFAQGSMTEPPRPLSVRLVSRKFVATVALLIFFYVACKSGVLEPSTFTMLLTWINGMYYGIDIGEIIQFRTGGNLGALKSIFKTPAVAAAAEAPAPKPE